MDNIEDFYLVLPSNSSMVYFPDNTTTCFTTHLCREIRLTTGNWLVGLAEIHIPCTVAHIQKSESSYSFKLGSGKIKFHEGDDIRVFPYGVYDSVEELASAINKASGVSQHQLLVPTEYQRGHYALRRVCQCDEPHYTTFNEKILRVFGFEDQIRRKTGTFVTSNSGTEFNVGVRPASLARAIPDQLFVYTDICEPYAVGDTQAALLRIVAFENSKYKFGAHMVKQFAPIHYIPVLQHSFQNIVIDIRDQHEKSIPFEYGTLTVTLHFKRSR